MFMAANLFKCFGQKSKAFLLFNLNSYNNGNFVSPRQAHVALNNYLSTYEYSDKTAALTDRRDSIQADLVSEKLNLGENDIIFVKLEQGKTGKRTIHLKKQFRSLNTEWRWKYIASPKLLVPNDAYNFVRALDKIIIACDGKDFYDRSAANTELFSEQIITDFYDISLNLSRIEKGQLFFKLLQRTKTERGISTNSFYISVDSLPWIRRTVAQILKENDDSEYLQKMPITKFPFSMKKKF